VAAQAAAAHEAAQHADMAEIDLRGCDSSLPQGVEHQPLHLDIAFESAVTEQLRAHLHRFARTVARKRQCMHDTARVTQPCHPFAIEQMRIDARRLRGDVGAQPQHATVQLIDQLEGAQVQVAARAGEERIEIFDGRWNDELIAVRDEQIQHAPAQPFDAHRLRGQRVFDVFGQHPARGQRSLRQWSWRRCAGALARASPAPSTLPDEIKQQHPRDHRAQAEKAHLPVAHFGQPPKRLAPQSRDEKRQEAFDDQDQGKRGEQHLRHRTPLAAR
jgi:hypothetical protein